MRLVPAAAAGTDRLTRLGPLRVVYGDPVEIDDLRDHVIICGYGRVGRSVAAVHVSHNLAIPFSDLKDKMTSGDNLGKSIHALKPEANAKAETKKANKEAKKDLEDTQS